MTGNPKPTLRLSQTCMWWPPPPSDSRHSFTHNHVDPLPSHPHTHLTHSHTLIDHHSLKGSFRTKHRQIPWSHPTPCRPTVTTHVGADGHTPHGVTVTCSGHIHSHAETLSPEEPCTQVPPSHALPPSPADPIVSTCCVLGRGLEADPTWCLREFAR